MIAKSSIESRVFWRVDLDNSCPLEPFIVMMLDRDTGGQFGGRYATKALALAVCQYHARQGLPQHPAGTRVFKLPSRNWAVAEAALAVAQAACPGDDVYIDMDGTTDELSIVRIPGQAFYEEVA